MDADEGGLLGNLPRSRPGTRSGKRDAQRPADSSQRAARATEERETASPREPARPDPLGDAVGAAAKLAGTGWRVATLVPREVLRRLPRP